MLCKWKNILGEPRVGVHALRAPLVDLALWDIVGTLVIALLVSWRYRTVPVWGAFLALFVFATGLHLLFCVETPITSMLTSSLQSIGI